MPFAYTKLSGLDSDRLIALIEPILSEHGLDGVELTWKTDGRGWVLSVTVERPGTRELGAGVSLDDCSLVSRGISAALDEQDLIGGAYRLEVGTPGVERKLYSLLDYTRFAGNTVKIKLHEALDGEYWVRGTLRGVDAQQRIQVATGSNSPKKSRKKHNHRGLNQPEDAETNSSDPSITETGERILSLPLENIHSAQLTLEWGQASEAKHGPTSGSKR